MTTQPASTTGAPRLGAALHDQLRRGEYREAIDAVAPLDGQPSASHADFHNLALAYYKMGDWSQARQHLEEALRRQPRLVASHLLLGLIAKESHETDEALAHLGRAIELDDQHARAHALRGAARLLRGEVESAETDLRRAIELDPGHTAAHHDLGVLYIQQRRWDAARLAFARCAELDPGNAARVFDLFVEIGRVQLREQLSSYGHQIKNRLGIQGDRIRSLLAQLGGPGPAAQARVDELKAEHDKIYHDMAAFLAAIGEEPGPVDLVDLHELIETCLFVASSSIEHLRVERQLSPDLPEIVCQPRPVREALLNLILNAGDAVGPAGGRLLISTTHDGQGLVYLTFSDDGPGIAADALERIFEFGYSTKDHGSGIGLAQARKVVEHHGGALRVESAPGRGARFIVQLPVNLRLRPALSRLGLRAELSEDPAGLLVDPADLGSRRF